MNIQILQQSIAENQVLVNNTIDTVFVTRFLNGMLRIPTEIRLRFKTLNNMPAITVILTYIIHSGFISGYQNRYGDNLKPPTNVYHRMTA